MEWLHSMACGLAQVQVAPPYTMPAVPASRQMPPYNANVSQRALNKLLKGDESVQTAAGIAAAAPHCCCCCKQVLPTHTARFSSHGMRVSEFPICSFNAKMVGGARWNS